MLDCIASIFKLKLTAPQKKAIEKQDGQGHVDRIFFCSWLKSFLAIPLEVNHIWELIRQNIGRFVTLDIHAEMILSQAQMEYELVLLTNGGIENQNRKITGIASGRPAQCRSTSRRSEKTCRPVL